MSFEPGSYLERLAPAARDAMLAGGTRRELAAGTALFHEGDRPGEVAVVTGGRCKLVSLTADGREVILAVRGPGDLVGELSVIDGLPRSAAAVAMEPVELVVFAAAPFRDLLARVPGAALALVELLATRLRDADRKRVEFGESDATGRVARRLAELAVRYGTANDDGEVRINLPLSQDELAGWTGASREAVARALRRLRSAGVLATRRRGITILDLDGLRRLVT